MSQESSLAPIHSDRSSPEPNSQNHAPDSKTNTPTSKNDAPVPLTTRRNRPSRACTIRAAARLYAASQATADRKPKPTKKELQRVFDDSAQQPKQCSKIITQLVDPPEPSQLPRWNIRSMWELASVLNFLHVFRPLLNISTEFSAEEFETALFTPNDTLSDIHMPLLKAIPPITRTALTRDTWITVLCRKLRDWWHWVADGELPIVASHGAEMETYKSLDPGIRVIILKALCDIRVEQEDIRSYIDNSLKHGIQLITFRKERVGGDAQGISYWYEDDPIIGYRLYREIRKTEVKKAKTKGSNVLCRTTYLWETVATNFDEFQDVSEKLFASKNRTEASLGKKLKIDMLPEIEIVHKKKEKLLKKQHRQALLLDNFLGVDGLAAGRSLRDRKPVTYTFDDYDRSINEAIKITKKKQSSPEPLPRSEAPLKPEPLTNGRWSCPLHAPQHMNFHVSSPKSPESDAAEDVHKNEVLDRSNRRRRRPTRYSEREFVEAVSDNESDFDSDDDIVGEAIYDEEYLMRRKQRRKFSSGSEGDDEYRWEEENAEEEEDEDSMNISEESDEPHEVKNLPCRTRRETKSRSVHDFQCGLRRSKRATRNRINYGHYEFSESETESMKPQKSNHSDERSNATENGDFSMESQYSDGNDDDQEENKRDQSVYDDQEENRIDQSAEVYPSTAAEDQKLPPEKMDDHPRHEEVEGMGKRRFLDLNELAPTTCFDDGSNSVKDEDNKIF